MSSYELGEFESQLISRIYEAALAPELWEDLLQVICNASGAYQCTMFFYDAQCRARNFAVAVKAKDGALDKYLNDFIDIEAADFHQQLRQLQEGQVVTPKDLIKLTGKSYDEIVGAEYMETFLPKLDFQAGIILLHDNMMCSGLGVRTVKGSPDLDAQGVDFLRRIAPHMVQAMKIHNHISKLTQTSLAIQEVLKRINQGVFLLDSNLRVIFSNAEAARILESCSSLEIGRQGRLFLQQENENQRLQSVFASLISPNRRFSRSTRKAIHLASGARDDSHPLKLTISRVDADVDTELHKEGIVIAVFVSDPDRPSQISDQYMQQAYALTATECSIMKALLKNKNIGDIAEMRGTTLETARSQLKVIMQKTGTHSQAELSRLLLALDNDV